MKKNIKTYIYGFLFLNILIVLLFLTNLIPQQSIYKNIKNSLSYYENLNIRTNLINGLSQTTDDIVADTTMLNIIYNIDSNNVIKSTLASNYYLSNDYYNKDLMNTVLNDKSPNTNYSRYWHGYMIVYRILLTFLTVNNIKIFMFTIFIIMLFIIAFIGLKKNMKEFHILLILSIILSSLYLGFISLEYPFPIFISLIGCIYILLHDNLDKNKLFLFLGISVAFFDFLTIETITLTLPLLCLLLKYKKENKILKFKKFLLLNINWMIGYIFTFIYKWILTYFCCNKEFISETITKGMEKISTDGISMFIGLKLNIQMLFPYIKSSSNAYFIFIIILFSFMLIFYLLHKKNCNKDNFIVYLLFIFFIPYLRYIVLSSHSFNHYFFTYRAQVSSIFVLLLILITSLDFNILKRRK